jgi:acyl-CoA thioesterase-1
MSVSDASLSEITGEAAGGVAGEVMEASLGRGGLTGYGVVRGLCNLRGLILVAAVALAGGAARAEPVTLAALGDSLTQGYGLLPEEGFVPQLQAWLDARGAEVTVVNAGVSGDTTAGGLSRVGWTLSGQVDAMIVALGGNDLLRGIDPAASRENLRGILEAARGAGVAVLLVGMEAPSNFGPEYKAAFDAIYADLAAEFGVALYPAFFGALLGEGGLEAARARFLQADGIHPNAAGVARIVEDIGPAVLALIGGVR